LEKRKLIKFGKNSYVISLPRDWIEANKLVKGSDVTLTKNGRDLLVTSDPNVIKNKNTITINCSKKDVTLIKRLILSSYINNFSTIVVRDFSQEQVAYIRKTIKNLFAVEMIEESKNKIVIKDMLNISDISLYEIIRRTDYIIKSMFAESIESFENNLYTDVSKRDDDVNRLSYLALRVVRLSLDENDVLKILKINSAEILHIWELIARIENIGDSVKRISEMVSKLKINEKPKKLLIAFYKDLKADFDNVMKCYYTKDEKLVYDLLSKSVENRMEIFKLNSLSKEIEFSFIIEQFYNIHESIKNIARSSVNTYLMIPNGN